MTGHRTYTRKLDHVSVRSPLLSRRIQAAPLLYQAACKIEDHKYFVQKNSFCGRSYEIFNIMTVIQMFILFKDFFLFITVRTFCFQI